MNFVKANCTYTTARVTTIKDWRAGLLYNGLLFLIIIYIVVFNIVLQQRYRIKALDLVGATRLQLRPPAPAFSKSAAASVFCGAGQGSTFGEYPPGSTSRTVPQYPCRYYDQYDVVDPYLEQGALFAASRISESSQTLSPGCLNQPTSACAYTVEDNTTFYVADLEMFTLLMDHTFSTSSLHKTATSSAMVGSIVDANGTTLNVCDDYTAQGYACPSYIHLGLVNQGADILPLRTLLRAAGIPSLDETSPTLGETHRYAGLILVCTIQYSNAFLTTKSMSESYYTYQYSVQAVQDAEFKAEEVFPSAGVSGNRTILDRHGIRLIVAQSGDIGAFDAATLLLSLTSSLGLLAVATLIVDNLLTRCWPRQAVYKQLKNFAFEDVELTSEQLKRFENEDLVNPPPRLFRALGISSTTRRRPEPSTAPSNNGDGSGGGGFFGGSRAAVEPVAIDVDSDGSDYAALYPGDLRMSSDASTALLAPAKEQPIYT